MDENNRMLAKEITEVLKELKNTEPGTPEYDKVLRQLKTEYDIMLEYDKLANSRLEATEKRQSDAKKVKFETILGGITVASNIAVALTTLFTQNRWFFSGLEFEKTGTICSTFVRNVANTVGKLKR